MQAEKVAGVDSELQIVINIFFFKGLYASLLTIYLKTFFLLCLVFLSTILATSAIRAFEYNEYRKETFFDLWDLSKTLATVIIVVCAPVSY